ncbi:MAG TPA: carbohydrate porin, partial [Gammaproteobacteria bacterium]|nr:carbohydrate porin [Gammaproteobacteria bacterium]
MVYTPGALAHGAQASAAHETDTAASNTGDTAMPARRALLDDEPHAFQWGLHIDTDTVANLRGGLQRGTVGNNVIHAAVAMDTGPLGAWRGGRLAASALRIVSGEASVHNIGDLQVADNLDARSDSKVYQLWFRQRFRAGTRHGPHFRLRGGLIDLNQHFAAVDAASLLLNSSFGIDPTLTANVPISTYPTPGWGLEGAATWKHWSAQLGVFQPNPDKRGQGFRNGRMSIGELDYQTTDGATQLKLGGWHYRQSDPATGTTPNRDWGAYALAQTDLTSGPNAPSAFVQLGHAPDRANAVPHYLGLGVQVPGPLPGRPQDGFTAGMARAEVRGAAAETSYELSYLVNLGRFVTLQPDLQYIRHP